MKKITIIGVGNMGKAIAAGLLKQKAVLPRDLMLSSHRLLDMKEFKKMGVSVTTDNKVAARNSGVVVLAVKPLALAAVLMEIRSVINKGQVIVSVAAGVTINTVKKAIGRNQPVVRVMPNLGAQVGESMSVWTKSKEVTSRQTRMIKRILKAIGQEYYVRNEKVIDKITVISGSGPAYVFYLAELLEVASLKLGLHKELARLLSRQTLIGSVEILKDSKKQFQMLRKEVTSKGGTTEAAFEVIDKSEFEKIFTKAIRAAYKKTQKMKHST